jgi:hypothetical protein
LIEDSAGGEHLSDFGVYQVDYFCLPRHAEITDYLDFVVSAIACFASHRL